MRALVVVAALLGVAGCRSSSSSAADLQTPPTGAADLAWAGGADLGGADLGSGEVGSDWWPPHVGALPWQWELAHEIVVANANDIGSGQTNYAGAPALAPLVYDIDGFDNTASDVAALHALGKRVICYIEVGALESYRPDASQFPLAVQGKAVSGYPNEKYLDITNATVLTLVEARIAMCAQKGFDAVEPDIDDSYTDDTGFAISESANVAYLGTLSAYARSLGLLWGLKNGGDGGTPAQFIGDMLPHIDFAVVEEPFFLHTISYFQPTLSSAGKAMFVAEYTNDTSSAATFCPQAVSDQANAALFSIQLDASTRTPCQ